MRNTIAKWKTTEVKLCSKIIWLRLSYISYSSVQVHGGIGKRMEGNRVNQAQPGKYSTGEPQKNLNIGILYQK